MSRSCQFSVRSGSRLKRNRFHARDFDQAITERLDDAQSALRNFLGLVGMPIRDAFQPRYYFVHTRVVLHCA